jgi:hypothetical protein
MSLFIGVARADCTHGINFYWGNAFIATKSEAYADVSGTNDIEVAELHGSFLATQRDSHKFELGSETSEVSVSSTSQVQFFLDDGDLGTRSWTWFATLSLTTDFCYKVQLTVKDNHYCVRL